MGVRRSGLGAILLVWWLGAASDGPEPYAAVQRFLGSWLGLVLLFGWILGMLLGYFTRSLGLGPVDRIIGLLFGIVRGMVLVGLLIIGGELLHLDQEEWWHHSKLVPYGESVGDWLRAMVGEKGEPWAKLERLTSVKVRPK